MNLLSKNGLSDIIPFANVIILGKVGGMLTMINFDVVKEILGTDNESIYRATISLDKIIIKALELLKDWINTRQKTKISISNNKGTMTVEAAKGKIVMFTDRIVIFINWVKALGTVLFAFHKRLPLTDQYFVLSL